MTNLIILEEDGKLYEIPDNSLGKFFSRGYQQLILISLDPDEKIEVGDICYYENGLGGGKFLVVNTKYGTYHELNVDPIEQYGMIEGGITPLKCEIFKVIATQSQLSPEYIKQFIEEYNKGEVKDVEIEMKEDYTSDIQEQGCDYIPDLYPKLTNGFITIVEKEPIVYTEEDCYRKLHNLMTDIKLYGYKINDDTDLKEWFNQNKKK